MPLPADWADCEIRWNGYLLDGSRPSGLLRITADVNRFFDDDPSVPALILAKQIVVAITAGTATFRLPVTDDPDVSPTGFSYTIVEEINGATGSTYSIEVPLASVAAGIDLAEVAPVPPSEGTGVSLVTRSEFDALEARVDVLEAGGVGIEAVHDGIISTVSGTGLIGVTHNDVANTTVISTTATANSSDATLLARANHTGTQTASTISDFNEAAQDAAASMFTGGSHSGISFSYSDAGNVINATVSGGGGGAATAGTTRARVYQSGGNTIAVDQAGATIASATTSAANNVTVIQAAINAVAGTYTPGTLTTLGHGGGGTVTLSDHLYEVSDTIEMRYGVSLVGEGSLDRNGFTAQAHSFQGTVLAPTSALGTMNVAATGTAVTRTPVLLLGLTQNANGTQSTTNPHGTHIRGIGIDMRRKTTAQGILICDTQFVTVADCVIGEATGSGGVGIEVISTNAPDDGAHGTDIRGCLIVACEKGIVANGSGSTDSLISDCRVLQCSSRTIEVGLSGGGGGWQITHCHLTTATADQTGATEGHIYVSGAPCVITGNYFDTTGGYSVYVESPMCVITGNYFKHSGTKAAPIYLTGTGRKSTITGNTAQGSSSCKALVQIASTTGQDYRPTITGNVLGDGDNTSIVGIACNNSGTVIAETNAAMTIARDGTANPFIWGNRIVQSAV